MAKPLRDSRIDAIKVIYSCHMNNTKASDIASTIIEDNDTVALKMALDTMANIEKIDSIISQSLVNYTLSRLNVVDRSIMELATYEMLEGTPAGIVINEALEITKMYSDAGDKKEVKFNNKVLDNISKNITR